MQHFRDNETKQLKMTGSRPFRILFLQNLSWVEHFVLYAWSSYFALILSCVDITKILKFKMAARQPFKNCLLPKVIQVID